MHAMRRSMGLLVTSTAVVGALSACGAVDPKDKPTDPRPPAQISVRAAITDDGVHISPATVGGGPVRIVFANLTKRPVRAAISGGDDDRRRTLKPITPGGTATIQTIVKEGSYRVLAGTGGTRVADLTVEGERPSSDGDLFLP